MLFLLLLYATNSMFGAIVIARVFSGTLNFLYNKILFLGSKQARLQALSYLFLALGIIMLSYIITLNLTFFWFATINCQANSGFYIVFCKLSCSKTFIYKNFLNVMF